MLRKRSRPAAQKEQAKGQMSSCFSSDASFVLQKARSSSSSFFTAVPGLFVGLSTKVSQDCDSVWSPTSPLDYKLFSSLGNTFARSPRSSPKRWDCGKVGLGLVDSLNGDAKPCGNVLGASESKNILFGSQLRISIPVSKTHLDGVRDSSLGAAPKSLPKDYGMSSRPLLRSSQLHLDFAKRAGFEPGELGKIHSCSADVGRSVFPLTRLMHEKPKSNSEVFSSELKDSHMGSPLARVGMDLDSSSGSLPMQIDSSFQGVMSSLSASDIELSEDYTCITSRGPNPKTTRIFGDCILESRSLQSQDYKNKLGVEAGGSPWVLRSSEESLLPGPSNDFLSFCFSCKKKLEGKDIYMYRGEKAFCSCDCREQEILIEEEMEKPTAESSISPGSSFHDVLFLE